LPIDPNLLEIIHNTQAECFEIKLGEHLAVLEYHLDGNDLIFTHTGVPPVLEGQGIGSRLARAGLEYAKEKGYRVIPLCSFIDAYIHRHPEYRDLVKE
jgi:predicted GNAT family acetyltransferase